MIWIILLFSFALRLISLNQSLWLDEAISVLAVRGHDLAYIWSHFFAVDVHPPGFYLLLWLTGNLFGWSEIIIRLPSVLLAIGTIYLTFKIGQLLFSKPVGLIAALLLAVNPLDLYYSEEARMYSLATFGVALSFYCFFKYLKGLRVRWWLYAISLVIIFWSDYLPYIVVLIQLGGFVLFRKNTKNRSFISGLLVGLLSLLPLIPLAWQQFVGGLKVATDLPTWGKIVGGAGFKELALLPLKTETGRISLAGNPLFKVLAGFTSLIYLYLLVCLWRRFNKPVVVLFAWLIIPPVLTFLVSFWIPLFSYYRFIFILPAFCLLVAISINSQKRVVQKLLGLVLIFLELTFCFIYLINPTFHREDWRGAVNFTDQFKNSDQIILFDDNNLEAPFIYYSQNLSPAKPGLDKIPADSSNINSLVAKLEGKNQVYLYDYLVDITDPNRILAQNLNSLGFKQTQTYNFNGVGFIYLYTRVNQ